MIPSPLIKWIGLALVTLHILNLYQEDYGTTVLATKDYPTIATRRNTSVIKVSRQVHNGALKRRLTFSFTLLILACLLLLNVFITEALEYQVILNFKK